MIMKQPRDTHPKAPISKGKKSLSHQPQTDLFTNLNEFFERHLGFFFWAGLAITAIFSLLLFDFRVSDGGDDSTYIVRAHDLLKNGIFPSFQGPLYPMVLAVFIAIAGVKVTLLKSLSFIFLLGQYFFFYKAFAKRIPAFLLVAILIIPSLSASLLYFASQTYSETFFMFLQSIFLFLVFKHIIDLWDKELTLKSDGLKYLFIGLIATASYYARNVGLVSMIALIAFLVVNQKWKHTLFAIGGIVASIVPLEMLKRIIWHSQMVQISAQGKTLLLKDAYTPAKGNEDLMGMVQRFFNNAHIYLSKHFFVFTGLKSTELPQATHSLTYLIFAVAIIALVMTFKKNKYLFFGTLYTAIFASVTFIAVQAHWDQPRLVIVIYPLLLLSILTGIYYLLNTNRGKKLQIVLPLMAGILFLTSFSSLFTATDKHSKTLQANLSGNKYYGMTPDWINYIEMSKYAAKTVPANELIACRKPDISFVYSGTKFHGIYSIPSLELDTFLRSLKVPPTQRVVALNLMKINESPNIQQAHTMLVKYTQSFVNANLLDENRTAKDSKVIGVYVVPTEIADSLIAKVKATGAELVEDLPAVMQKMDKEGWNYAIQNPEAMLQDLKDNHVRYIILASLRKVPQYNTGEIVSTIHRYIYFIQLKYPNIVSQVHTIGDTETATLLKLNY